MKKFLKTRPQKVRQSIKHIKTCLKQNVNLKETTIRKKYLNIKIMLKKTWNIIDQVIGKTNKSGSRPPTKLVINKNDVTSGIGIANEFNKFFANIGPELAGKIPTASRTFESFLNNIDTTIPGDPITINELKEAAFFLKNKEKRRL